MSRILLDCDGVLANYVQYFLNWVEDNYGLKATYDQVIHTDAEKAIGLPKNVEALFWDEIEMGDHCKDIEPYPGAADFVQKLQVKHEVWACTAIPGPKDWANPGPSWMKQRSEWLTRVVGIPVKRQILCGRNAKEFMGADYLIDDNFETVINWSLNHFEGTGVLFTQPWNQRFKSDCNVTNWGRVDSYQEILDVLIPR